MFATIRRHQAWLYWIIAGVTIASFVVFGPSSCNNMNRASGGGANYGTIGGRRITKEELDQMQREVALRYFLSTQQWPDAKSAQNMRLEAYKNLFLAAKAKELGVEISADTLAEFARRILEAFRISYDEFVSQVLKPQGLDDTDFERYLHQEGSVQQMIMAAGVSGKLVTTQEAETLYRQEHEELASSMIYFSASNYMGSVVITNDALMQFYTNRMSVYREPARVQVNYVKYNVTNYWEASVKAITNLDLIVSENVKKMGTNLFRRAKTPEESRAAIKNAVIREDALRRARREAGQFADELYAMQPKKTENLQALAKQKGLTVSSTAPFDQENGPKDLDVLLNFPQAAFQLTEAEPFSGSVMAEDGVYVLGLKQQFPSEVPSFKAVEAKVTADYRYYQATLLMQQAGMKYYNNLTNGLAQGTSFTVLCAKLGLNTEALPPISLSTGSLPEDLENKIGLNELRQMSFTTPVGGMSPLARARYGAFILHVEKKLPVDEVKLKTELPGFIAYMRQARQTDAFNQWFTGQIRQDPAFDSLLRQLAQETQMRPGTARR